MKKIIISIVTIVYNDHNHIERTIHSVLDQDYPYIDYVIVDGASTDGTKECIYRYEAFLGTLISEPDKGIYDAMNKGLQAVKGNYVLFMNSGDCFSDQSVVSKIVNYIKSSGYFPELVYGDYRESSVEGKSPIIPSRSYKKIWYGAFASHQSIFYNCQFLKEKGLKYDLSYQIAADYKLNLEVVKYAKGNILQFPMCISDFDITGISNNNQALGLTEADRARKEVLGMSLLVRTSIILVSCIARFMKKYLNPIYRTLRMKR